MKHASISRRWIALHPTLRLDAGFWLKVASQVPPDADDAAVRAAIKRVEDADRLQPK